MGSNSATSAVVLLVALATGAALAQPAPGDIAITTITDQLQGPVGVFNAGDGSHRLFVIEQRGVVRVVRNGALMPEPFLTLAGGDTCRDTPGGPLRSVGFPGAFGESGLLGFAFHPAFEANGVFFVSYTGPNGESLVTRYTMASPASSVLAAGDRESCLIVLRIDPAGSNHNGGNLAFGPDGYLYFGLGDGDSNGDSCERAQALRPSDVDPGCPANATFVATGGNPDTRALHGKMLRIDVDTTTPAGTNGLCAARADGAANYAAPASNPFAAGDMLGRCDEIWSYGLRNPWRWSFDRTNGDLFIGDVGEGTWEEIDRVAASSGGGRGVDFDWPDCEARHVRSSCAPCSADGSEVVMEYDQGGTCNAESFGCAVTGGFRYRGPDAVLAGVYFFGDACLGNAFYSTESAGTWSQPTAARSVATGFEGGLIGGIHSFGEDEFGALYAVGGTKMVRIGAPAPILFIDGFE